MEMTERFRAAQARAQGAEDLLWACQVAYRFHVLGDPLVTAQEAEDALERALRVSMPPDTWALWKASAAALAAASKEDTERGFV